MTKSRDLANAATALNAVTAVELGYVDGVTSAIQTQLDAKLASSTAATTYVANSLADAKGDLFVASADNTVTRLPVGSTGETIVVDSSTATGLRYQGSMAAGRNFVINGGMDIWQRGTSFAIAASTAASASTYTADRWQTKTQANQAIVVSRQATGDTTNLPNIQYAMRVQRNSGQTGTGDLDMIQNLETVNSIPFAGKIVTFSFYARKGADYSATSSALAARIFTGTGTDQNIYSGYTGTVTTTVGTATLTTTWQRFSYSMTIGATATQIALDFFYSPVGTAGTNDYYEVTGVQLEVGSVATPFSRAGGTIQGELAAAQRYYERFYSDSSYGFMGTAVGNGTTAAQGAIQFKVTKRIVPTAIEIANLAVTDIGTSNTAVTSASLTSTNSSTSIGQVQFNVASGLTDKRPYYIGGNNNSSAYIAFTSEL